MSKYIHPVILLLGLALGSAWWFMVKPTQDEQLQSLEQQIQRAEQLQQQNTAAYAIASAELPRKKALLAEAQASIAALTSTFSNEEYQPNLLDFINNLAVRHSLSVTSITEKDRIQIYPDVIGVIYELNTTGRFQDQLELFTSIQRNPVRTTILNTTLQSMRKTNPRAPQLETTTTFQSYVTGNLPPEDEAEEEQLASGGNQ